MAKNTVAQFELESWTEADLSLKKVAECQLALDTIEAEMNMKINDAKAEAKKLAEPLQLVIEDQKKLIQDYVEGHKAELDGKSKQLTFGRVGFRQSTSVTVPTKKIPRIIENLRKFGMENCIKVTESVNKDILATYESKDIVKIGASVKTVDRFFCEPDKEKVR